MNTDRFVNKIVNIVIVLAILLSSIACLSSSETDNNTEGNAPNTSVKIRPLNYVFREDKDGWNVGFVRMYLINTSKKTISSFNFSLQSASVQTAEGKSYPVELFSFYRADVERYVGDAYTYEGGIEELEWPQQVQVGDDFPLVPQFPVMPFLEKNGAHYVFAFRFAKATTPTKMELETSNGTTIFDLSKVEKTLPSPDLNSESLADFARLVNQDTQSIQFTMEDKCTYDRNWKFSIAYALTNKDKFDETHFTIPGGYAVYYADGSTRNWPDWKVVDETIGPDQTIQGTFDFSQFAGLELHPLYLLYYENNNKVRVYKVLCSEQ